MSKGVDRAVPFTSKDLAIIKRHGYGFIGRYLSRSKWKALTKAEARRISDAGLFIVTVYQDSNNKPELFNYAAGIRQAKEAVKQAMAIGQPAGKGHPIYFAVDMDARGLGALDRVVEFFRGVVAGMSGSGYPVGVYGSYDTIKHVVAKVPAVTFKWQTVAWSKNQVGLMDGRSGSAPMRVDLFQKKIDCPLPEDPKSLPYVDLMESDGSGGGWKLGEVKA